GYWDPATAKKMVANLATFLLSGSGLRLTPSRSSNPVGGRASLRARLLDKGKAVPLAQIRFEVSGPDTGAAGLCQSWVGNCKTGPLGDVIFGLSNGGTTGTDVVRAFVDDNGNGTLDTNERRTQASVDWLEPVHYTAL